MVLAEDDHPRGRVRRPGLRARPATSPDDHDGIGCERWQGAFPAACAFPLQDASPLSVLTAPMRLTTTPCLGLTTPLLRLTTPCLCVITPCLCVIITVLVQSHPFSPYGHQTRLEASFQYGLTIGVSRTGGVSVNCCRISTMIHYSAQAEGLHARFMEGDAEELLCKDSSFDVVTSLRGAMCAPRPDVVARALLRVCSPGGTSAMGNGTPEGCVGPPFALCPPPAAGPVPTGRPRAPARPAAGRSETPRDWGWTGDARWARVGASGVTWGAGLGRGDVGEAG